MQRLALVCVLGAIAIWAFGERTRARAQEKAGAWEYGRLNLYWAPGEDEPRFGWMGRDHANGTAAELWKTLGGGAVENPGGVHFLNLLATKGWVLVNHSVGATSQKQQTFWHHWWHLKRAK